MYLFTREKILDLLYRTAEGLVPLDEFESRFSSLFVHREDYPILDHRDKDYFGEILERVGWTGDNPSEEERQWGWIDFATFKSWLKDLLEKYESGAPRALDQSLTTGELSGMVSAVVTFPADDDPKKHRKANAHP
jgi:hypothetical protein